MTTLVSSDSQRTANKAGLRNRDYATARLLLEIERGHRFSVLMVHFDGLSGATYLRGSASTDAVWGRVLGVLTKDLTGRDLCCRFGDEEFLLILPERTEAECRVLRERIQDRWMPLPRALEAKVEMRIGIASFPDHRPDHGSDHGSNPIPGRRGGREDGIGSPHAGPTVG